MDLGPVRPRDDDYEAALPTGADALLVVEVADTTLGYDTPRKPGLTQGEGSRSCGLLRSAALPRAIACSYSLIPAMRATPAERMFAATTC